MEWLAFTPLLIAISGLLVTKLWDEYDERKLQRRSEHAYWLDADVDKEAEKLLAKDHDN